MKKKKKKPRNELQHRQRKEVSRKSTNFDDIHEQPGTAMVVGARKRKTRAIVVEHEIISPIQLPQQQQSSQKFIAP